MEITYRSIDDLIPYERNAKLHPDSQVARIAKSIEEFGFRNPVLVDGKSEIVAGHGRVLGAKRAGLTEVPTIDASDLTPEQVRAYRIADNKLAESGFYESLMQQEILELQGKGIDLQEFVDLPPAVDPETEVGQQKTNQKTCPFCGHVFE